MSICKKEDTNTSESKRALSETALDAGDRTLAAEEDERVDDLWADGGAGDVDRLGPGGTDGVPLLLSSAFAEQRRVRPERSFFLYSPARRQENPANRSQVRAGLRRLQAPRSCRAFLIMPVAFQAHASCRMAVLCGHQVPVVVKKEGPNERAAAPACIRWVSPPKSSTVVRLQDGPMLAREGAIPFRKVLGPFCHAFDDQHGDLHGGVTPPALPINHVQHLPAK